MHVATITVSVVLFSQFVRINAKRSVEQVRWCERKTDNLKLVVERIVREMATHSNCIVFITDSIYRGLIDMHAIERSSFLSQYDIGIRDNDDFSRPRKKIVKTLQHVKATGCDAYVVLISNGLLTSRFLQYVEGERLINTRGYFLLLHDNRLFRPELHYIWNRIVNVVFIRRSNMHKYRSGERITVEQIDLNTVNYPSRTRDFTEIKYIDSWRNGKLHYDNNHYKPKTTDLRGKGLRVAVFEHIPAVTEASREYYDQNTTTASPKALGIEFELIRVIAKAMNFKANYYLPTNIANERWGKMEDNDTYTGLIGEAVAENADFFLGDLHYTLSHLYYFDLSTPYNTECLTFLTPEALTDNSWKILILPFSQDTWIVLLCTLLLGGVASHVFALFYEKYIGSRMPRKHDRANEYDDMSGLYLFTEFQNSILYTYSMLLQVSLPRLPNAMTVRVFIGWWWIYSILAAVMYRASMTATLSRPAPKVTIDTLEQLTTSSLEIGGWDEDSKEFFLASSDPNSQEIGNKFELTGDEDNAMDRVANGTFGYYENSYLLQHARGKLLFEKLKSRLNATSTEVVYNPHIMEECVVYMPIALGLEKNSPLKPHVDLWVRRMTEIGLVHKWLSDVMEWSKINESRQKSKSETALVDLRKLYGAFIALLIGYFLGLVVLFGEILHWRYVVLKDPRYDKYRLDAFYRNNNNRSKT